MLGEFIDNIRFPFFKIRKDEAGIDHFQVFWLDECGPGFFDSEAEEFEKEARPAEK
jgi:hypothetical protein